MPRKFITIVVNELVLWLTVLVALSTQAQRPLGTDVSNHQPGINWAVVKNAGVQFAWAKATEGTYYTDPYLSSHVGGAKTVGIYVGAYHFARPSSDPNITGPNSADTEAAFFWNVASNYVKNGGSYLVPMLDWEDTGATVANGFTTTQMSQWVNEWCLAVSNYAAQAGVVGVRPVVYTGTWYSIPGTYPGLNSTVTTWPSWIAAYPVGSFDPQTASPSSTYPWPSWDIWQYGNTNWSGGDSDVYNGTFANFLRTFAVGGTNVPNFVTGPVNLTVTPGATATFSANVSGLSPISFRWSFDGTNIPGATSSNLTVTKVQLANAGSYVLTASNSYASIPGSTVYLTVVSNADNSVLAPGNMVNWWPGNNTPVDIYGGNDATPYNNLSYANGKVGSAFHLGSTNYLLVNGATELSPNWTVCMWVYRQNAPGTSASLMGDGTYALKLEQYNTTREVGITQSGVADYLFSPAYTVPVNTWTHLAFVGTSSGVTLFANGVLKGSVSVSNFPLPRAAIGVDLISGGPTDYMLGSLDEIQVFNRALGGSEIAAIYAAGNNGLVSAPQFTEITPTNSSQIQVDFRGQTGKTFTLYSSTNLLNGWTSIKTISNPTGATNYTDSISGDRQKFYRVTQP